MEAYSGFRAGKPVEHGPVQDVGGCPGISPGECMQVLADVGEKADGGVTKCV